MTFIFSRLAPYFQPRRLSFTRLSIAGLLLVFGVLAACAPSIDREEAVHILTYEGNVDPVMARYIDRGIDEAERTNARAVVIQLDTLGGLVTSMEKIVKRINTSQVPVIVYVQPAGAQAASAGTFITMAGHIAAMAPGSVIGAASPVGSGGQDIEGTLGEKIKEDLAALIRGIAVERGRNVAWAEKAVTEALAANACEAVGRCEVSEGREPPCMIDDEGVKRCIVDFEASSLESVLEQADGRRVNVGDAAVTLDLVDAPGGIVHNNRTVIERFFAILSDPNIAFLLLSLGGAAIFIEILNPGLLFPGIFGIIALVLAFFSIGTLPINWAGMALIGLAFVLFAAEIFVSGFGILGIGGAVSLILGGLLLTSTSNADFQVNRWLLYSVAIVFAAFFIVVGGALLRSRRGSATIGIESLVGKVGVARTVLDPGGTVLLDGAGWNAHTSGDDIEEGESVVVTAIDGLTVTVEKPEEEDPEQSG